MPFFLRPNFPPEGKPKPPDTPGNPRVNPRLKAAGAAVGIDFTGKTDRAPNTLLAHTLMSYALSQEGEDKQNALSEILFRHYFTDGLYPDVTNLKSAAAEAGLDVDKAVTWMTDVDKQKDVAKEAAAISNRGVHGVPYFYFNGKDFGLSGAQPPDTFLQAFQAVSE
eukprot:TRINITY_DN66817_c10_g1_i2.p1 TRINITY_DN66817_c10_g1~~TRINITY_DN66817_c10_g1_i2.p1  ORF type:complete len:166 (+),score=28.00 TRINITY_DN66817_c10_g1_i2:235-732(+)